MDSRLARLRFPLARSAGVEPDPSSSRGSRWRGRGGGRRRHSPGWYFARAFHCFCNIELNFSRERERAYMFDEIQWKRFYTWSIIISLLHRILLAVKLFAWAATYSGVLAAIVTWYYLGVSDFANLVISFDWLVPYEDAWAHFLGRSSEKWSDFDLDTH